MTELIDYGAWSAARLRDGAKVDDLDHARIIGIWREWLGVCRASNGGDRRAAFDSWARSLPERDDIIARVFAIPPTLTVYPEPEKQALREITVYTDVPELPAPARITGAMERAASDTGQFLSDFADYIGLIVNTIPREMAEASALSIVSIAVARRLYIETYFDPQIFPLLWILWVAESTVFHKTTALNAARRMIRQLMGYLLLPNESSGDRLIQDLAGIKPSNFEQIPLFEQSQWRLGARHSGQRGIVIDEASSLFSGFRKDYNVGKVEVFLKAYDCDDQQVHSTVKHGNIYMRWLYMPMLGATTPAAIQQAANLQMWQMGFWPRFVTLVPERLFPDSIRHSDDLISRPAALDQTIATLLERLPEPDDSAIFEHGDAPKALAVTYSKEAWRHWIKYDDAMSHTLQHPDMTPDDRLRKMYGRQPVKLLQVATLLAALDWNGKGAPHVALSHYARAHQIVECWRTNAHRFVEVMDRPLTGEDRERRILTTIARLADKQLPATTRELQRATGWPRDQVDKLLEQMTNDGLIGPEESANKRTKFWRLIKDVPTH
jgi:hypothetical protein